MELRIPILFINGTRFSLLGLLLTPPANDYLSVTWLEPPPISTDKMHK